MIVNQRFSSNLPANVVQSVVNYIVHPSFQTDVMEPFIRDVKRRFLTPVSPFGQLIAIQHSGWFTRSLNPTYMVTLRCVATLGLLDVMLLSHEGTHDTSLIWLMAPKAHIYKASDYGVVVASSVPHKNDKINILSNEDGLMIQADSRNLSTAVIHAEAYPFETY